MPFWAWLVGVVLLAALFWPWLVFFAGFIVVVGVVGAITNRGGRR